jgi:hypothetical protein
MPSGDGNIGYAMYITRGAALSSDAVSAIALNDTSASLSATSALYTWQAFMAPTTTSTHVNATFASGSATWSMNGASGSLTSGVDSAAISVPIGESDLSITYTPTSGSAIVYHVLLKRHVLITDMWFEGTTVSSPTNFDSSTTVTVPLTPVWDANASGLSPGFRVSIPHGVVKGRVVLTYSRVGEQNVSQYVVNDVGSKNYVYDSVTKTGTVTSGWTTLEVGENRIVVSSGTVMPSGDGNIGYAMYITRRGATVVPGQPLIRAAEPVDATSALVSWDPPTSDGGEAIESYTVTSNSVANVALGTCVTTTNSCLFTGLITGATYTFTVIAKNVNGNGPVSVATSAVTILAAPSTPSTPSTPNTPSTPTAPAPVVVVAQAPVVNTPAPAAVVDPAALAAAKLKARTISAKKSVGPKTLAKRVGVKVVSPKAKVSMTVARSSKKNCAIIAGKLKTIKAGRCVVTFTVQEPKSKGKKPKARKTVKTLIIQKG